MHVWKEMYGYVSITVGCRWKFHSVLKIVLYKYGNVENLQDNRKMKATNVCMFLEYRKCCLSMVWCEKEYAMLMKC